MEPWVHGLTKTSQKRNLSESLVNSQIITNHHTVLLHAVSEGHFEICKLLIEHTNDPNPHDDNYKDTALHDAAEYGNTEIFKFIMERAGESNPTNLREITPLHKAVENGSLEIAKLIIEDENFFNGADLNGFTPLHLALDGYDQPEMVTDTSYQTTVSSQQTEVDVLRQTDSWGVPSRSNHWQT